jgi:hypothetical protein
VNVKTAYPFTSKQWIDSETGFGNRMVKKRKKANKRKKIFWDFTRSLEDKQKTCKNDNLS